jgi:uncharacterized protein (DUF305 family)
VEVSDAAGPDLDAPEDAASSSAAGSGGSDAAASPLDEWPEPRPGWTTLKVLGLVAAVGFVAVMLALALQSRFDGEAEDSVDVGFMRDMIAHHEQAIQLGLLGVANTQDPGVNHFAQEAIVAQQWEVGYMTALLEDWGYDTGVLDRDAMAWMGMPTPLAEMPGMATPEQLAALRDASGAEADALFLQLMTDHHVGGVHMAEAAAATANDERVVALAERMARNQQREIQEYQRQADALGVTLEPIQVD